jgi:tetratricopeptide (TPR) repeat protein
LAAILLWVYPGFLIKNSGGYEREALAYFRAGDYAEAIKTCELIQERNPKRCLGFLILGNIHFLEGDLIKAKWQYDMALKAEQGSDTEKSEALIGLGRIASIENNVDQALTLYRQAAKLAPAKGQPYVSQAMLLERQGKYDEALNLFAKARALSPDDSSIEAVINETQEKLALISNRERQERIDRLVRELLDSLDKPVSPAPWDGWTSLPLTVWLMDFEILGHGLQEGEERLVASDIKGQLIEKSRVRIVERGILEKLMEELKLGTSRLVDKGTALSLGKIMAARVISSGQIMHAGPQTQAAVRLIETETGEVTASVSEVFVNPVSPSVMAEKLSRILLGKLQALYPLRGKIAEVREKEIILNIGQKQGVRIGQGFKVIDTDWILEVRAVQTDQSVAAVKRGYGSLQAGLRVEVLKED